MPKQKYFLKIFLPLAVITVIIIFLFCYIEIKNHLKNISEMAVSTVDGENQIFDNTIYTIKSDALFLKKEAEMKYEYHYQQQQKPFELFATRLTNTFLSFAKNRRIYDQIRFISVDGQELLRVNRRDDVIQVAPKDQLQNKKDRYYFVKSIELNNNEVYFSPLDLNIENQKIEYPFRPMIRVGTPVYNNIGKKLGIIVLNYNAQYLLDNLKQHTSSIPGDLFLIDQQGHFSIATDNNYTWGNTIPARQNLTVETMFPQLWKQLNLQSQRSKLYTKYGMFFIKNFTSNLPTLKYSDLQLTLLWRINWKQTLPDTVKYYLIILVILLVAITLISRSLSLLQVKRAEHEEQLRIFATTDSLTSIYNRRSLLTMGTLEFERSKRTGKTFSVLMFDIDHFKKINDTYGHLNGDQALISIAKIAKDIIRKIDIFARFGGEEFIILMPETSMKAAIILANRLHQAIARMKMPLIDNQQQFFSLTVSIGISSWHKNDKNIDDVINRADQQLYRAKTSGRNRVMADNT